MSLHSRTNAVGPAIGLVGNSCGSSLCRGLRPNLAFEPTRRLSLSTWPMSMRRAAQLGRWASIDTW